MSVSTASPRNVKMGLQLVPHLWVAKTKPVLRWGEILCVQIFQTAPRKRLETCLLIVRAVNNIVDPKAASEIYICESKVNAMTSSPQPNSIKACNSFAPFLPFLILPSVSANITQYSNCDWSLQSYHPQTCAYKVRSVCFKQSLSSSRITWFTNQPKNHEVSATRTTMWGVGDWSYLLGDVPRGLSNNDWCCLSNKPQPEVCLTWDILVQFSS